MKGWWSGRSFYFWGGRWKVFWLIFLFLGRIDENLMLGWSKIFQNDSDQRVMVWLIVLFLGRIDGMMMAWLIKDFLVDQRVMVWSIVLFLTRIDERVMVCSIKDFLEWCWLKGDVLVNWWYWAMVWWIEDFWGDQKKKTWLSLCPFMYQHMFPPMDKVTTKFWNSGLSLCWAFIQGKKGICGGLIQLNLV